MSEKFEMSGQDEPKTDSSPSNDPELNEMLERLGKIVEEGPDRSKEPIKPSAQQEEEERLYRKFREADRRRKEKERIRQEKEKARKTKNLVTDATRRQWNEKLPENELPM